MQAKRLERLAPEVNIQGMQLVLIFAVAVAANAIGTILIKVGSSKIDGISLSPQSVWSIVSNFYIMSGVGLYAASFPAYSYILQKLNVSVAFPMFTSISFAAVILISSLFLKESLTVLQFFGLILVVGGIVLLSAGAAK